MVSAIASRKYERAALSRLFRFTLAIQPTVQAEHRSDREVTMWPTRCSRPWAFSLTGNLTLSHVRGNRQRRECQRPTNNSEQTAGWSDRTGL